MKIYEKQFYEIIIRELPRIRKSLDLLQKQNRAGIIKIIEGYQDEIHDLKKALRVYPFQKTNKKNK